jgi:hypothetical protein
VTKESIASARDYFERAMKLDRQSAEAIDRLRLRWSPRGEGGDKAGEVEKFHQNGSCLRAMNAPAGVV